MIFAALLAGGIGKRINSDKPKQFITLCGKPLIIHSIENFINVDIIDKIIVSSPKNYISTTKKLVQEYFQNNEKIVIIQGGKTRNDTILNSIEYIKTNFEDKDPILITHDAARIFVNKELIEKSIENLKDYDATSAVIPPVDVIFKINKNNHLDEIPLRENLVHAQTPQSFKINTFIELYKTLTIDEIDKLDEAMMLFYLRDKKISLFEGDPKNFKITRPIDLKIAETFLKENY